MPEMNGVLTRHPRLSFGTRSLEVFYKLRFPTRQSGATTRLNSKCRFYRCMESFFRIDDLVENLTEYLFRYPRLKLTNRLQDSNVLICHRSIIELLQKKRKLESLSKGFLPWLCRINHSRSKKEAYNIRKSIPRSLRRPPG